MWERLIMLNPPSPFRDKNIPQFLTEQEDVAAHFASNQNLDIRLLHGKHDKLVPPGKSQHLLPSWLRVPCLSVVAAKQQAAAAGRPNLQGIGFGGDQDTTMTRTTTTSPSPSSTSTNNNSNNKWKHWCHGRRLRCCHACTKALTSMHVPPRKRCKQQECSTPARHETPQGFRIPLFLESGSCEIHKLYAAMKCCLTLTCRWVFQGPLLS